MSFFLKFSSYNTFPITPLVSTFYLALKISVDDVPSVVFVFPLPRDVLPMTHPLGTTRMSILICNLPASLNDSLHSLYIIVPIFLKRLEHITHTFSGSQLTYDIADTALAIIDITASKISL